MVGNRITALLQDNNGDLWMGSDSSVMRCHNGVFTAYGSESGVSKGMVSGIMLDSSGNLIILSTQSVCAGIRDVWKLCTLDRFQTVR
jgi:ligand-binding sensor domain-containing protein